MSSHRKHSRHINHSNEDNNINIEKKVDENNENNENNLNNENASPFNSNTIAELFNSINPKDLSSLLSNFNLDGLKTVNQDEVIKEEKTTREFSEPDIKNNAKRNTTLEFLAALKPLVSYERGQILDKMIQIYSIGSIFKR